MSSKNWSSGDANAARRGEAIMRLLDRWNVSPGTRVLDIGCGEGGVLGALTARTALAVGADSALRLLQRGRTAVDPKRAAIRFVASDATALPFRDAVFDLVVLYDVLEHVAAWERVVDETRRVLRSGGRAIVTASNPRSPVTAIDDPHWHLPLVAVLPRSLAERIVTVSGRRMPDIDGSFPVLPSWRRLVSAFASANFKVELISNTEKLRDPESILSPGKRNLARSGFGRALRISANDFPVRVGVMLYDRALARSWTFLLTKR